MQGKVAASLVREQRRSYRCKLHLQVAEIVVKSMEKQLEHSRKIIERREKALLKRDRLRPCIDLYHETCSRLQAAGSQNVHVEVLGHLTDILRNTYQIVLGQIADSGKVGINATNAVKRSAGTNFQGLCEYALIQWLKTTNLPYCIGPNAPRSLRDELTIYGEDADGGSFSVEPDIDISLWVEDDVPQSPIIFVSAKTSLVDRAGQAARWKMYLDMHQTTCTHVSSVLDCPINRTKVKVNTTHPIVHSIVTANIYKIDTTHPQGELGNGQCRNNTYMFRYKYTTRNDATEFKPESWRSFSEITQLIREIYQNYQASLGVQPLSSPRLVPTGA